MQKVDPNQKNKKRNTLPLLLGGVGIVSLVVGMVVASVLPIPFLSKTEVAQTSDELKKFQTVYDLLSNEWYYSKDDENIKTTLIENALSGMTTIPEDPHTSYLELERANAFSDALAGSNVGIGVRFFTDTQNRFIVKDVYINSAADRAGIQPGDEIVKVAKQEVTGKSADDVAKIIQSNANQSMGMQVSRNGETIDMMVTPGTFDETVCASMLEDNGLITMNSFSKDTAKDFTDAVGRLREQGAKNLILDLRNNTGGYLSSVIQIASSLLPADSVVFQECLKDGTVKTIKTEDNYAQVEFDHIYILQNKKTASASEILIGALKDHIPDKVTTLGQTTYGKGTEQNTIPFEDGSSIKFTKAEWKTPNGLSINKVGFIPDVEVALSEVATVSYVPVSEESPLNITPDSVHSNAKAAQIYLRYLGYPAQRSDEYFSVESSEALKSFQSDHGLEPTGVIDNTTFQTMLDLLSKKLNEESLSNDSVINRTLEMIHSGEIPAPAVQPGAQEATSEQQTAE
ncbi:MAG: S41 family peptidase [Erysipelotrichaceae bacterium]|nr:S41 family peptidase [Erysipelotrichaceae bacterium]